MKYKILERALDKALVDMEHYANLGVELSRKLYAVIEDREAFSKCVIEITDCFHKQMEVSSRYSIIMKELYSPPTKIISLKPNKWIPLN